MRWQDKIRVGTSGYNYPGWAGPFYPKGTGRGRMLSVYSECFDTVELNFTYYGIPGPESISRMVRETPPTFGIFVKGYKGITHEGRAEEHLPAFLSCLEPALKAGKLRGVLLQFPQSFHNTPENRDFLESLLSALGRLQVVVEVRHDCWLKKEFFGLLRERGAAFCCVDEPRLPGLVPPIAVATGKIGYLRLHSRNGALWYSGDGRYDYNYSREELLGWMERLRQMAAMTRAVYVFFNNCHGAQAAANAILLRRLLGQEASPPIRPIQRPLFA